MALAGRPVKHSNKHVDDRAGSLNICPRRSRGLRGGMTSAVRLCLLCVLLVAGVDSAQAADLIAETPAVYDWSGFYIGVNAGYGFAGKTDLTISGVDGKIGDLHLSGPFGGGQVSANWQSGPWVIGAEADVQLANIIDSDKQAVSALGGDYEFKSNSEIDWFSTVRLRSGIAMDNILLYGTGGVAFAGLDASATIVDPVYGTIKWSDDYTDTGWTAGGGVEWGISKNASAKIEYLYVGLGNKDLGGSSQLEDAKVKASTNFQTIRLGVDFHF
jgi:outer membrane immunogenic protein